VVRTHVGFSSGVSVGTTIGAGILVLLLTALLACGAGSSKARPLHPSGAQSLLDPSHLQASDAAALAPTDHVREGGEHAGERGAGEGGDAAKPRPAPSLHENSTAVGALCTPELYLLWLAMFCASRRHPHSHSQRRLPLHTASTWRSISFGIPPTALLHPASTWRSIAFGSRCRTHCPPHSEHVDCTWTR
jgi:hypothetical protein